MFLRLTKCYLILLLCMCKFCVVYLYVYTAASWTNHVHSWRPIEKCSPKQITLGNELKYKSYLKKKAYKEINWAGLFSKLRETYLCDCWKFSGWPKSFETTVTLNLPIQLFSPWVNLKSVSHKILLRLFPHRAVKQHPDSRHFSFLIPTHLDLRRFLPN